MDVSSWNYRVIRRQVGDGMIYEVYEVYYNRDGDPVSMTAQPTWPMGETLKELSHDIENYAKARDLPVLDYDDIPPNKEPEGK